MKRSNRTSLKSLAFAVAAFAGLAGLTVIASPKAEAQVAAKVESQTRPNFGVLLDPAPRQRSRARHQRWRPRVPHYPNGGVYHPPGQFPSGPGGTEQSISIDCGSNPGSGAIEAAVRRLRPGGTLILSGNTCVGNIVIEKNLTIIGQTRFDRESRDGRGSSAALARQPVTLTPFDGQPCLRVGNGATVTIRDVVFDARRSGDVPCIIGFDSVILLDSVGINYAGDEAAIFMEGGDLDIRDSAIDAATVGAAIEADGATITAEELDIRGAQVGMDLTPGDARPSDLQQVWMKGIDRDYSFGPRSIGLIVRAARTYGQVKVNRSRICGYSEGISLEGGVLEVTDSVICHAYRGAVVRGGRLTLSDNRIRATDTGVLTDTGESYINNNVFGRVRDPFIDQGRGTSHPNGNRVWSDSTYCRPDMEDRYRGRHEPRFRTRDGNHCPTEPFPREYWQESEGWYDGANYQDDRYPLQGYDQFRAGYGWYDCEGRYINASRPSGNDRWTEGRNRQECRREQRRSDY